MRRIGCASALRTSATERLNRLVEIADTRHIGGVAIGVCSDENINGSGVCDQHKRVQLIEAGADCVIPDFRDAIGIIDQLLGQG